MALQHDKPLAARTHSEPRQFGRGRRQRDRAHAKSPLCNPSTGSSTQLDPIGLAGGLNSYGFGAGDPINFSDPYGTAAIPLAFLAGAAVRQGFRLLGGAIMTAFVLRFRDALRSESEGSPTQPAANPAPLPDGLTGTNPRETSGRINTDGAGIPEEKFDELTGGQSVTDSNGHRVGANGVRLRPGTETKGPRIDIPAKGDRKHETIHWPAPKP